MNEAAKPGQANSLIAILVDRAATHPDRTAYHFIGDDPESDIKLSYRELLQEAISLAVSLQIMQLPGKPVLLICKGNLFTIIGFYACLMAGALPIPTAPPRRPSLAERIRLIAARSGAAAVLTDSDAMLDMQIDLPMMDLRHGRPCANDPPRLWHADRPPTDQAALILYTSGAGGDPHGVVHSQASLMAASRAAGISFGHDDGRSAILLSLPLFHETGLMLGVIHPMAAGVPVYLMTPAQFVERPERWLRLIEQLDISTTGGPNFMFDVLIREVEAGQLAPLDLSCLRACFCSGEPVRAGTMDRLRDLLKPSRLRPEAILPCYSLAEAGRHVTGGVGNIASRGSSAPEQLAPGRAGLVHPLVSCGKPHIDCRLLIVNPAHRRVVASGDLGEIWLQCASVALGYWNEPALTTAIFGARLQDGDGVFLRTGDLAMLRDGELYVLGRLDERIRIGGADHAPYELELQVERSHIGLRPSCAAVFSVELAGRLRLVVVCELKREMLRCREKWPHIESAIRSAIRRVHGLAVDDMVLLAPGALPKTSSGKVRRNQCRDDYLAGSLMLANAVTAE
ncbi:MAG: AMP-binding enzyme family protein [Burkholderia sp.]|nr:AMP-binding enzyme family protein [Burkholderia sp.]